MEAGSEERGVLVQFKAQDRYAEAAREAEEKGPAAAEAWNAQIAQEVQNFHAWVRSTTERVL